MMVVYPGGPLLVAIADAVEVAADLIRYPCIHLIGLQGIVHPIRRVDLVSLVFTIDEI